MYEKYSILYKVEFTQNTINTKHPYKINLYSKNIGLKYQITEL